VNNAVIEHENMDDFVEKALRELHDGELLISTRQRMLYKNYLLSPILPPSIIKDMRT